MHEFMLKEIENFLVCMLKTASTINFQYGHHGHTSSITHVHVHIKLRQKQITFS